MGLTLILHFFVGLISNWCRSKGLCHIWVVVEFPLPREKGQTLGHVLLLWDTSNLEDSNPYKHIRPEVQISQFLPSAPVKYECDSIGLTNNEGGFSNPSRPGLVSWSSPGSSWVFQVLCQSRPADLKIFSPQGSTLSWEATVAMATVRLLGGVHGGVL